MGIVAADALYRAGRVTHSSSTGQWQYPTYNALGQRVEDYQSAGSSDSMKLYYPRDIFGQRTGIWDDHSSLGWVGWDVYFSQVAGQRLNMGGADAYIDHADAVGSTTMETDPAGAVQWDVTHYPWGGVFQEQGARQSEFVMGLDWQINDPVIPSATRELSSALGRWLTPDPLGGDVTNPQSLNRYAYALNNPTTLTDPLGLCPKGDYPADMTGPCRPGLGSGGGWGGGWSGAWGVESCGVDPFCIENGGIGPFGSPVAQGGSYQTATYEIGGWYYVPEAVAAEEARWQAILADFAAKREANYEKRQQEALLQCSASGICNFVSLGPTHNEGFTFSVTNGPGLKALLTNGHFTANDYTGLLHEGVTGAGTMDYRSINGWFGSGSLQVDVGSKGGYIDVDRLNPDQGVFSFLGHTFLEVVPHWFRGY